MNRIAGFTLIELLLVAVILGILAAVVVPQFSADTTSTKEQALKSNLAALRSAIDRYAFDHKGKFPGNENGGFGNPDSEENIIKALTLYSRSDGTVTTSKEPISYGPYLRSFPVEPLSGKSKMTVAWDPKKTTPTGTEGWFYNRALGQIVKNCQNNAVDAAGVQYNTY